MKFHQARTFRKTDGVVFQDLWIPDQNGLDLVIHRGYASSPPNDHFYIHYNQVDNNRLLDGIRIFELIDRYGALNYGHYLVLLTPEVGALQIPVGVYHRSFSCPGGSILVNQAVRTEYFNEQTEFKSVSARNEVYLSTILQQDKPRYINGSAYTINKLLEDWLTYPESQP